MALGVKTGDEVIFEIDGIDEEAAAEEVQKLFQREFAM